MTTEQQAKCWDVEGTPEQWQRWETLRARHGIGKEWDRAQERWDQIVDELAVCQDEERRRELLFELDEVQGLLRWEAQDWGSVFGINGTRPTCDESCGCDAIDRLVVAAVRQPDGQVSKALLDAYDEARSTLDEIQAEIDELVADEDLWDAIQRHGELQEHRTRAMHHSDALQRAMGQLNLAPLLADEIAGFLGTL